MFTCFIITFLIRVNLLLLYRFKPLWSLNLQFYRCKDNLVFNTLFYFFLFFVFFTMQTFALHLTGYTSEKTKNIWFLLQFALSLHAE